MTLETRPRIRYWDDLSEGDELEGFSLVVSETKIAEQVSGSQDFYPVHHDREFARAGGHPDIFVNTGFTRGALCRLLTDFAGIEGTVTFLRYEMRRMNRPGDSMKVCGKVAKKYVNDAGLACVDIDLWIENPREGVTTPAKGTVVLPVRS